MRILNSTMIIIDVSYVQNVRKVLENITESFSTTVENRNITLEDVKPKSGIQIIPIISNTKNVHQNLDKKH